MMNKIFTILFLSVFLFACAKTELNDLQSFVKQEKAKKSGKIPPLPEFVQYKMYTYNGNVVRDPFIPVVDVEIVTKSGYSGPRPDDNRIKEPLENFSLDSLRMMGTLQKGDASWILVKDPDGLLHRVTIGNYVGLNNGKITEMYDDSVEVLELIPDGKGWQERKTGLAMSE